MKYGKIQNFEKIRADGKIITEDITLEVMLKQEWGISKIIALRWSVDGRPISIRAPQGMVPRLSDARDYIAVMFLETHKRDVISIFTADGTAIGTISGPVKVGSKTLTGSFAWFEGAMKPGPEFIGAIFQADNGLTIRCDINVADLKVVDAIFIRC